MGSLWSGLFLRRLHRAWDVCSGRRRNVWTARPAMPDPCRFRRLGAAKIAIDAGFKGHVAASRTGYRGNRQLLSIAKSFCICDRHKPVANQQLKFDVERPFCNGLSPDRKGRKQTRCFASHHTPLHGCRLVFRESVSHDRICMAVANSVFALQHSDEFHVLRWIVHPHERLPITDRTAVCLLDRWKIGSRSFDLVGGHSVSAPFRAASIAATSIFLIDIIASNARFACSPPAVSASIRVRGVICQDTPHLSLHQPHSLS